MLFLCCPPSSTVCSQGISISPLKQPPPGEAYLRMLCIWVEKLTKFIKMPVIGGSMAGEYVTIFGTDLQMLETARPVHSKGKAKSPIRVLPTAHQNLVSHLSLAFKLDSPNTCTLQGCGLRPPCLAFTCSCFSAAVCSE